MQLLSPVDQVLLNLENRKQPMHVGGLLIFEKPKDAKDDFLNDIVKNMLSHDIKPSFPFNQLIDKGLFWKQDDDFDVDQHFRYIALPKPASLKELLVYVSQEHGKLMNRARPLWECHLIDGLTDNRFAFYFKMHHAMIDGVSAMRMVQKSLSKNPNEIINLPVWALMTRHDKTHQSGTTKNLWQIATEQVNSILPVGKELYKNLKERFSKNYISTTQAPDSLLNQPICSTRQIAVQSYPLQKLKELAKKHHVTFNDIILAICSGALRRYLLDLNALPKKPLIAFVPVSLREEEEKTSVGNQITFILANLATHMADPKMRLNTIHGSTKNSKRRFARMNQISTINYSLLVYSRAMFQVLTGLYPEYRGFNLIISNVPASSQPLYFNGAKLQSLYPASVNMNDQAMNMTFCTYHDRLDFSITACSKVLPKIDKILTYMAEEIAIYDNFD